MVELRPELKDTFSEETNKTLEEMSPETFDEIMDMAIANKAFESLEKVDDDILQVIISDLQ